MNFFLPEFVVNHQLLKKNLFITFYQLAFVLNFSLLGEACPHLLRNIYSAKYILRSGVISFTDPTSKKYGFGIGYYL